jgi:hypothetical protein
MVYFWDEVRLQNLQIWEVWKDKRISIIITVAFYGFYISVSDHNATDTVMQKSCNLWRRLFCALYWRISPFSSFISIKYIYFLTLYVFYDQPVHFIHLYSSLQTNIPQLVSNFLQLGKHGFWMAANSTQDSMLVRRENY